MLACIIFSIHAEAQFFSFSGNVKSPEGVPLPGANVYFKNLNFGSVTNPEGTFTFEKLPSGKYFLRISYLGYETYKGEINLTSDINENFVLHPVIIAGEEAVIRAVRVGKTDPFAVTDITKDDISVINSGKDMPYLLSMTTSFVPTSDAGTGIGYTGFRIRGTDAFRINITMNGVPLNDAESHGVWWVNMPDFASSVNNMQIQRGVGTSTNGAAAFGASLNIQTLSLNNKPYAEVSTSLGSYNTKKHSVSAGTGLLNNRLTLDLRLSSIYSDGYIDRAFADLKSYYLSAGWHTNKSRLKLITFSGTEKTYQAWDGVPEYTLDVSRTYNGMGKYTNEMGEDTFYNNETDNYQQQHYHLHYFREFKPDFYVNTTLHYTKGAGFYEQYKEEEKLSDYLIPDITVGSEIINSTDLIRRKWLDNDFYGLVFSAVYKNNKMENIIGGGYNIYDGDHFGDIIWARYAGISEINQHWYDNNGIKKDFNIFGKVKYNLTGTFNTYADLQLRGIDYRIDGLDDDLIDISQTHNYIFFNPKIGCNYNIGDNKRAYFSFSIAHREPDRSNFKDAKKGDPVPLHEILYDYETGCNIKYNDWALDMNFYYMDYDNQLVLTGEINDVGDPVMKNVKSSYRIGLELVSSVIFSEKMRWNANITLSRNKIRNVNILVDNWDYWNDPDNEPFQYTYPKKITNISFSPGLTAGSSLEYKLFREFTFTLHSKYVGKQYIDNSGSEERKLDPYFLNDIIIHYSLKGRYVKHLDVSLNLINVFNVKYISNAWVYRYFENKEEKRFDGFFPQAGLHFITGLTFNF